MIQSNINFSWKYSSSKSIPKMGSTTSSCRKNKEAILEVEEIPV